MIICCTHFVPRCSSFSSFAAFVALSLFFHNTHSSQHSLITTHSQKYDRSHINPEHTIIATWKFPERDNCDVKISAKREWKSEHIKLRSSRYALVLQIITYGLGTEVFSANLCWRKHEIMILLTILTASRCRPARSRSVPVPWTLVGR